jgi:UPF0716 family protein affecting phage T7 exclusion
LIEKEIGVMITFLIVVVSFLIGFIFGGTFTINHYKKRAEENKVVEINGIVYKFIKVNPQ